VLIRFGERIDEATHQQIVRISRYLENHRFPGMSEHVPAYTTIAVHYDPCGLPTPPTEGEPYAVACHLLRELLASIPADPAPDSRQFEIPVCYDQEFGPDLAFVASHNRLSPEEVIRIHAGTLYRVNLIGFVPGFPYLGGMSHRIAAPRRDAPRTSVPAGSVGIAGNQTGIYPIASPGGWQLIGRTPGRLFSPDRIPPATLNIGDQVRFRPIPRAEFDELASAE
jgi:inhibitor of KinA